MEEHVQSCRSDLRDLESQEHNMPQRFQIQLKVTISNGYNLPQRKQLQYEPVVEVCPLFLNKVVYYKQHMGLVFPVILGPERLQACSSDLLIMVSLVHDHCKRFYR